MSDWISDGEIADASRPLLLATVRPKVEGPTAKELTKAEEAKEFVRRSGYPSEGEAVAMVQDGNFDTMPVETKVVRTSFKELGEHPAVARGKMTKQKVSWGAKKDMELICEEKN